MKRRTPILKLSSFNDPQSKPLIQQQLYTRTIQEIKANVNTNAKEIILAQVQDDVLGDNSYYDIKIDRDGFIPNLENILSFYERNEDYEQCALIKETLNDLKK